jgi:threonine aldolase
MESYRIDLRSDTVTLPSDGMRAAMSEAPVGDDQYGEDPTVNSLQDRFAALFGKEAAIFLPSGTMTNQVALNVLTRPGDDVLIADEAHLVWHETGAAAANSGVQFTVIGRNGIFSGEDIRQSAKPLGHTVFPPTRLVVVENTHNRAGGVIFPAANTASVLSAAKERGLRTYLDGARLFNVAVATRETLARLSVGFDLVGVSLSKGLGCPIGSILMGSLTDIAAAVRVRRRFGGALRQAGILAAAAHFALDNNIDRLVDDHANAQRLAVMLASVEGIVLDLASVQTNIVIFKLKASMPDAAEIVRRAKKENVLVAAFGERTVRMATHLNVDAQQCEGAAEILKTVLSG